jgi:hypothetical protein
MSLNDVSGFLHALVAVMWPLIFIWLASRYRYEIGQLLGRLKRGKIFGQEIEFNESIDERRNATITVREEGVVGQSEVTDMQDKILRTFLEKGDYDTLNISSALVNDFKKLKELGLLSWETETQMQTNTGIAVTQFVLTDSGKQRAKLARGHG